MRDGEQQASSTSGGSTQHHPKQELEALVIWVQTIPCSRRSSAWREKLLQQTPRHGARMVVVDGCGSDPFGWDDQGDEDEQKGMNLEHLDVLLETIQKQVRSSSVEATGSRNEDNQASSPRPRVSLIVESLTPLLVRHGPDRVIRFLQKLSNDLRPVVLVVPVLVETWKSSQLRRLEDLAHAVLRLNDGEAEILRQGVREKGNRVRERWPFRINDDQTIEVLQSSPSIDNEASQSNTNAPTTTQKGEEEEPINSAVASLSVSSIGDHRRASGGSSQAHRTGKKVQLQADEGNRRRASPETTTPAAPRIFMQEDDPEFEDYDEEDPDDDLDL